jgi:hypothetical protein
MADMNWLQQMLYDLNRVPDDALPPGAESIIIGPKGDQGYFKPGPPLSMDYAPMLAETAAQTMPIPGAGLIPDALKALGGVADQTVPFAQAMGQNIQGGLQAGMDTVMRAVDTSPSPREIALAQTAEKLNAQNMAHAQAKRDAQHNAQVMQSINTMLSLAKGTPKSDMYTAGPGDEITRGDGTKVEGAGFSKSAKGTSARQSKNLGFGDEFKDMLSGTGLPAPMAQLLSEARRKNPEVAAQILGSMLGRQQKEDPIKEFANLTKGGLTQPSSAAAIMGVLNPERAPQMDMIRRLMLAKNPEEQQAIWNEMIGRK